MDQPRKVAKPVRVQLNREIKCPSRCIRGKYIDLDMYCCLHLFIYQVYFFWGVMYIRARFTACKHIYACLQRYVCRPIVDMYGHHIYSKGKDQPGKVANPARGQLAELGQ